MSYDCGHSNKQTERRRGGGYYTLFSEVLAFCVFIYANLLRTRVEIIVLKHEYSVSIH